MEKTRDAGVFTPFVSAIGTALEPLGLDVLHALFAYTEGPFGKAHADAARWLASVVLWELRRRDGDPRPFPLDELAKWDDGRVADFLNGLLVLESAAADELADVLVRSMVKVACAECYCRLKARRIAGLN